MIAAKLPVRAALAGRKAPHARALSVRSFRHRVGGVAAAGSACQAWRPAARIPPPDAPCRTNVRPGGLAIARFGLGALTAVGKAAAPSSAPEPTAATLDSRRAKTTKKGAWDGAKQVYGRMRHLLVDAGGLLLHVLVSTPPPSLTATARDWRIGAAGRTRATRGRCSPGPSKRLT